MDCFCKFATAIASGGPFFSVLPEKKGGEKGRLVTVWCFLRLSLGEHLYFKRRSTRDSPHGRPTTRRLIRWVSNLELVALEQLLSIEGAVENRMVFTFLRDRL